MKFIRDIEITKTLKIITLAAILILSAIVFYTAYQASIYPTDLKINPDIQKNYLKIEDKEITVITQSSDWQDENFLLQTFRKDTLKGSGTTKTISKYTFFGLEERIKLHEVTSLKVKGLTGDNYYVISAERIVKDNKELTSIKLSHVNSSILKTLNNEPEKEIIVDKDLSFLNENTIITLSSNDEITTNANVHEGTINYKVKKKTYYNYNETSSDKVMKRNIIISPIFIGPLAILLIILILTI